MPVKFLKIFLAVLIISALPSAAQKNDKKKAAGDPAIANGYAPGLPGADSLGFTGVLEPSYFYTEGVKQSLLHSDQKKAVAFFEKAIKLDSLHAPSYYGIAQSLALTAPQEALLYSETANRIDSTNVWYKKQLGRLFVATGDYAKAQKLYEELIVLTPRNAENYSMLAALYEYTKQPFSAIAVLDKAEKSAGFIEELSRYKRELLISVRLYDKAIEEGKALVANYPYNYESYLALAQLYAETKNDSLAVENYKTALALNPDGVDVIASMNEYYKIKGDNANYLATAKQLVTSDKLSLDIKIRILKDITSNLNFYRENYFTIRDLAATLYLQYPKNYDVIEIYSDNIRGWGDYEEALNLYKDFVADTITDVRPFMEILNIEAYLKRSDSVTKYASTALAHFPDSIELYIRQGAALSYMGKEKDAVKAYEKALKHTASDSVKSVVYGIIGDEYHMAGNDKKSYASYDKALRLWPDNVVVLNNYAYFLSVKEKELEKALEMAAKVMELEPSNPTYMDTYGWVLFKLGRLEEAKKIIQQAVALDARKSGELMVHYGDILFAMGDSYMAEVYWKRALEAGYDPEEIAKRLLEAGE